MNPTKKLADDVNLIAPEARIIIIGGTDGAVNLDHTPLLWKGASVIGLYIGLATPQQSAQIHAAIYSGLENGTLRPAVAQEFALSEVAESHETVRLASSSGKVMLKF
jgi:NADPH:quinone reductase